MKTIAISSGDRFFASEKGKYRFFYPKEQPISATVESGYELITTAPTQVRCPRKFNNLKPYLVTKEFARSNGLEYRIIWME